MEIQKETTRGVDVFSVKGRLDSNTSETFEKTIYESMDNGTTGMILNLQDLEYISSAGLRVILKATKDLKRKNGQLVLCSLQDYVREVFEIAGFDGYLTIESALDNAVKVLEQ